MKVTKFPNKISSKKRTMVLGAFSSFHNGHKLLLEIAKTYKNKVIVMIIDDLSSLKNYKKEYHSLDVRLQHLSNIGVDEVVVVEFHSKIQSMSGKQFATILKDTYNVQWFVVGKDFAMGKKASYKAEDLQKDFDTTIEKIKKVNGKKLGTTLLREFVEFGDVKAVKKNSPFYFTINVDVKADKSFKVKGLIPHTGLYATWTIVNDVKYPSLVRISATGTHEIKVPDLHVKNAGFKAQIEFAEKVRLVIRKDFDIFNENDADISLEMLKNHL